ncbi:MAG: iron ABC transporter permease [Rikenellaceae bacterium]
MKRNLIFTLLSIVTVLLFVANIVYGSVTIPFGEVLSALFGGDDTQGVNSIIILSSRMPGAITALLAGGALAVSGMLLQTLFGNPLADPSILGVSSGAGLGVAVVMLGLGGSLSTLGLYGHLAVVFAAFVGAAVILGAIIAFSTKIKSNIMLLVVGIMIGYIASSAITMLNFYAQSDGVVSYIIWGMGDFSGVTESNLIYFLVFVLIGLASSVFLIKPLNALLLGERYSENLGVNIRRIRIFVLIVTGILTAVVTAFCGPISFIGLAVPHIARLLFRTSGHGVLVPATILIGSIVALSCNLLSVVLFNGTVIPLNVITPLVGAPVIIYVIINKKKIAYFN